MTEMKILPVERAIEWIRAWTDLDWPITWETAYATRDKLGWVPAPDDGRFFVTELSVNGEEDGNINKFNGRCSGASIPLTSLNISGADDHSWQARVWEFYDGCLDVLMSRYGPRVRSGSRDKVVEMRWVLLNGVALSVLGSFGGVEAVVDSPEITKINQRELHYIEKYGEDYVED